MTNQISHKITRRLGLLERKAAKYAANKKGLTFDYYQDFLDWAEARGYKVYSTKIVTTNK